MRKPPSNRKAMRATTGRKERTPVGIANLVKAPLAI
jgi:hypothetical protein